MNKAVTGKLGELAAGRYLRENGYEIITANYRCRLGEIDIIAKQNKYICFVEVKTRSENYKYAPADAVTFSKRKKDPEHLYVGRITSGKQVYRVMLSNR